MWEKRVNEVKRDVDKKKINREQMLNKATFSLRHINFIICRDTKTKKSKLNFEKRN